MRRGVLARAPGEEPGPLEQKVREIESRMIEKLEQLRHLENAAAVFQNQFWRDFYRALAEGLPRRSLVKLSVAVLCFGMLAAPRARAADHLNLVIAVDLSQSVAVKDSDNEPEFRRNLDAVARLLAITPAGARVTVLGITDRSFAQPHILLAAEVGEDAGYFNERIAAARAALARRWRAQCAHVQPHSPHTDILGALTIASEVFKHTPAGRSVLVIFSDMRQDSAVLNLERPAMIQLQAALQKVQTQRAVPDLNGVEVYALGVDGAGKSLAYWTALSDFWAEYFKKTGAHLRSYSVLRETPAIGP